jgi:(1->4)-alpha-D-glucan 1-alpha-D-glucosylmutase
LSEVAQDWDAAVHGWREHNAPLIVQAGGMRCPSIGHEYMFYQALVGAWPGKADKGFVARMQAYALKAAREAKQETSWTNPNEAYETALQDFVGKVLDPDASAAFLASLSEFAERTTLLGALNGLSQLALKAMLPGVPDFYQGSEFWDVSLVDPDNRRPVDFDLRRRVLEEEAEPDWPALAARWQDGRIKLALTRRLLALRQHFADVFQRGSYEPLPVEGPHAGHVIAFARSFRRQRLVVVVARHFAALTDGGRHWPASWEGRIGAQSKMTYEPLLGGEEGRRTSDLSLAGLFSELPVCVLLSV